MVQLHENRAVFGGRHTFLATELLNSESLSRGCAMTPTSTVRGTAGDSR